MSRLGDFVTEPFRRRTLALVAFCAVAACAEAEPEPDPELGVDEADTTEYITPAFPDVDTTQGMTSTLPVPTQSGSVAVRLSEWEMVLSEDTIPAGQTTFEITNTGSVPHAFEVEGQGMEEETENIPPGQTVTLAVDLQAGRYVTYCPLVTDSVSHEAEGMTTTLYVR